MKPLSKDSQKILHFKRGVSAGRTQSAPNRRSASEHATSPFSQRRSRIFSRLFPFSLLLALSFQTVGYSFEPRIKLAGRKDLVLSAESRGTVLEIGYIHLAEKDDAFLGQASELSSPFGFQGAAPVAPVAVQDDGTPEPQVAAMVNYNDASVLAAVASTFAKKVRGSIARGATSYLQLDGGTLLKPGTSFPVRIPQAKNQTFTLTISEISSDGYTLQLGEASQSMSYDNAADSSAGRIQLSN